ncbi:type II secretion system F family protein [Paenibacillus sedimenti]|uniref:Type II secretion system F family protein n=1 Tax=Paenibacillus sedimenti TaxID=2770274 RepID=A0A926KUS6_9BACL|nr:type II secretion system F family protein [Paenibacillus sedimenti]MBD0382370.1 type II secretion system F family protein [Paenibacillus sedimenti]
MLTAMVMLTALLFFTAIFQGLFNTNRQINRRMKKFLDLNDKKKLGKKRFNFIVQMQVYRQQMKERVLTKKKSDKLEQMILRSGVAMAPEEYVMFQWIAALLLGVLLFVIKNNMAIVIFGFVIGFMLPRFWIKKKTRERMKKFNDGLEDMIMTVIGSLRAGFSFAQALKTVVDESDAPIRDEIELLLKEMQYGTSMEEALEHLKERMPSEDLDLLVQAVLIQRQVGGNLALVLETIVHTIRDRNKIQRQIKTLTAQGRISGWVIGLLPFGLSVALYLIEPSYIGALFTHQIGLMLVGGASISMIIGLFLIRKMTTIEV